MRNIKVLNSIDLSSFTTIMTGINVLISVLISLFVVIVFAITSPASIGVSIYIVPTIIVSGFITGIYRYFSDGLFYNLLSSKLRNIYFIFDNNELVKVSTTETATIVATITLIQAVLLYLVSVMLLPMIMNAAIQTLMFSGQQIMAYSLYQMMMVMTQPMTIIMILFGSFIITFVFVLIGTYLYNFIASKGRGITLELSKENEMTSIDSIDVMKFAIAFSIVSGVLDLIVGIIMVISGGTVMSLLSNVISGFVGGFIVAALIAVFYNFLAPKLGKLKLELIDH